MLTRTRTFPKSGWLYLGFSWLLLLWLAVTPAQAQTLARFRMMPDPAQTHSSQSAYFVYEAAAGETITDHLLVANVSNSPLRLRLYPADAITAANGGIAIANSQAETPTGAGTWLQLAQTEVALAGEAQVTVPFTLSLPHDLAPGEYAATLVAQSTAVSETQATNGVRFIPRTGVSVLVTVPDIEPLPQEMEIATLTAAVDNRQQMIVSQLRNTGRDGIPQISGNLTIQNEMEQLVFESPVRMGYFLAGDDLAYRAGVTPVLAAGRYRVTLALDYEEEHIEKSDWLHLEAPQPLPELNPNMEPIVPLQQVGAVVTPSPAPAMPQTIVTGLPLTWAFGGALIILLLLLLVSALLLKLRRKA